MLSDSHWQVHRSGNDEARDYVSFTIVHNPDIIHPPAQISSPVACYHIKGAPNL